MFQSIALLGNDRATPMSAAKLYIAAFMMYHVFGNR